MLPLISSSSSSEKSEGTEGPSESKSATRRRVVVGPTRRGLLLLELAPPVNMAGVGWEEEKW